MTKSTKRRKPEPPWSEANDEIVAAKRGPNDTPLRFDTTTTSGRILSATLDCIVEGGIASTSTRAISTRAGIRQGLIHYHFSTKNELLLKVLASLFENSKRNIEAAAASSAPPERKIERVMDLGFALIGPRRREFVALVAFWAHAMAREGPWKQVYQSLFRTFRRAIIEIIEDGVRRGVFRRGICQAAAVTIVALVQGVGMQYVMDPDGIDIETTAAEAKTLVLEMLRNART